MEDNYTAEKSTDEHMISIEQLLIILLAPIELRFNPENGKLLGKKWSYTV